MNEAISPVPLCVDLDETLIRTDVLWESVIQLWRSPLVALRALWTLIVSGKAAFKTLISDAVTIDPATLPYREDVLQYVKSQRAAGRVVVLATATHRKVAERIAQHLDLFGKVFATERGINLSGTRKRAALESAYGARGFDYIGDDRKDLVVFAVARQALLVDPSPWLLARANDAGNVARVFSRRERGPKVLARAIRVHQWAKNLLLAVPVVTAHLVMDVQAWISVAIAFCAFSLAASATYLINDLVDLQSDRRHSQKRSRPLANGDLAIPVALMLALTLGSVAFGVATTFLPSAFTAYLAAYVALTLGYSLDLKRRVGVDALALAALYTLRILAGGAAIAVGVSEWLLMFSLFMFISLAFLKRAVELQGAESGARVPGRGYLRADLETIRAFGMSSGLLSVLVFALYINSPTVAALYQSPQTLWLMCPLFIYWITRMWFLAGRGEVHHDPVVFALLDGRSYVVGAGCVLIVFLATVGPRLGPP